MNTPASNQPDQLTISRVRLKRLSARGDNAAEQLTGWVADEYGWPAEEGVRPDGSGAAWNRLPDGTVLDACRDDRQILVVTPPDSDRYVAGADAAVAAGEAAPDLVAPDHVTVGPVDPVEPAAASTTDDVSPAADAPAVVHVAVEPTPLADTDANDTNIDVNDGDGVAAGNESAAVADESTVDESVAPEIVTDVPTARPDSPFQDGVVLASGAIPSWATGSTPTDDATTPGETDTAPTSEPPSWATVAPEPEIAAPSFAGVEPAVDVPHHAPDVPAATDESVATSAVETPQPELDDQPSPALPSWAAVSPADRTPVAETPTTSPAEEPEPEIDEVAPASEVNETDASADDLTIADQAVRRSRRNKQPKASKEPKAKKVKPAKTKPEKKARIPKAEKAPKVKAKSDGTFFARIGAGAVLFLLAISLLPVLGTATGAFGLYPVTDDGAPGYRKGDLMITNGTNATDLAAGDAVVFRSPANNDHVVREAQAVDVEGGAVAVTLPGDGATNWELRLAGGDTVQTPSQTFALAGWVLLVLGGTLIRAGLAVAAVALIGLAVATARRERKNAGAHLKVNAPVGFEDLAADGGTFPGPAAADEKVEATA